MLRRFTPTSSSSSLFFHLLTVSSSRFCSSASAAAAPTTTATTTVTAKKFDPVEFAKEQERRRQTEPRQAFWTPSGTTNIQAEIDHLEKQRAALLEQDKKRRQQEEDEQTSRRVWGRDTIELVENMQNVSDAAPVSKKVQQLQKNPKSQQQQESSSKTSAQQQGGILAQVAASRPLTSRLDSLYKNYSGREQKTQEAQDALLKARKEQLKWREIDYQLDQVRLDRDLLQWYHYIKRGKDYAIDCELERELRYFPEHVAKELRTNLKFLVGSSKLPKSGPSFPTIQKLTKLSSISSSSSSSTTKQKRKYEEDLILPSHFSCPTVVFISQLAHSSEKVEDIDRFYVPLVREAVSNLHNTSQNTNTNNSSSKQKTTSSSSASNDNNDNNSNNTGNDAERKTVQKCSPRDVPNIVTELTSDVKYLGKFDFMYLKSADFQSSIWMRKWLTKVHGARINTVLAPRTYTGVRLLRNFSSTLGLRNYGAQYVMLVDHTGKIRWLSTGPPTAEEAEWFVEHCRTLQKLQMVAKAK